MSVVLVTGANGFVGQHLCRLLAKHGHAVRCAVRDPRTMPVNSEYEVVTIGDIGADTDWRSALQNVDQVVHLAARVHVMEETELDSLAEFRRVNTIGSAKLAESAAAARVQRFIYVSSIKVHGEKTDGSPFRSSDRVAPTDPYAISKLEAEEALDQLARESAFELVILRPSLIYGPGVGGNFLRAMKIVDKRIPIPLGLIKNARSMLAVHNLCDLIQVCLEHPAAARRIFLAADGIDMSTSDLFRKLGKHMGKPARLVPVPHQLLVLGGKMFRRSNEVARLCDSLQVNIETTKDVLNWSPPIPIDDAIQATVDWYVGMERQSFD